ncbi:hypothetical protein BOX15_Mlig004214g7 [Macrostomum lignano]|uniref:Reverse transcriptase n=1 Tax=Macrostomum lignano TaxID=282301 RepID=A0A267DET5_9PLAT|nr:hypothetical protein BOX15_Mlig004214g7 [Macrostomum lignano]
MADSGSLKPPAPFSFDENKAEKWRKWINGFKLFLTATKREKEADEVKTAILLTALGEQGRDIYDTLDLTEGNSFDQIVAAFEKFCKPLDCETFERYKFRMRTQQQFEEFDHYLGELRTLIKQCNFAKPMASETIENAILRDQIVYGVHNPSVRERLLEQDKLTLEKAIALCRACEASKVQAQKMIGKAYENPRPSVDTVKKMAPTAKHQRNRVRNSSQGSRKDLHQGRTSCRYCGKQHTFGSKHCPAFGKMCSNCRRKNHFKAMCQQKFRNNPTRHVRLVDEHDDENDEDTGGSLTKSWAVSSVASSDQMAGNNENKTARTNSKTIASVLVEDRQLISFKIDTGADVNIMSAKRLRQITKKEYREDRSTQLVVYNKQRLTVLGQIQLLLRHQNEEIQAKFFVIAEDNMPLLETNTAESLGLIRILHAVQQDVPVSEEPLTKEVILKEYANVFEGLGCLPGTHHIVLQTNAVPRVQGPRKVPFAALKALRDELHRLSEQGMISQCSHPTEWVSNVVVVWKPDSSVRLCLDPQSLNEFIIRDRYPIPSYNEIISKMTGAKFFSTFDAIAGFHQVALDHESSLLTAFHTPFGVYRWNRLPFGLKDAPEAYQRKIREEITSHVANSANYIDDIIVWGRTRKEHDDLVRQLLQQCKDKNLKLNKTKAKIGQRELKFLGHILTSEGVKIDPEKIRSIKDMPHPNSYSQISEKAAQLQRFIGSANFLSKFIPNFSALASPLRQLLKKDVAWNWGKWQEEAYEAIKESLCKAPLLGQFNLDQSVILSVDASKDGLGAALMQDGHVIEYASSSMTPAQKKYAQIEKEFLAIVFGCCRFRQYLWGRHVQVESDHKPLQFIMKKPLSELSARLQRLALKIQEFDLNVTYVPRKELYLADTLSRAYLKSVHSSNDIDDDIQCQILGVARVCLPDNLLKDIQHHTNADDLCHKLKDQIREGWPDAKSQIAEELKPFWNIRHELMENDRLIYKSSKIFIPDSMRRQMLQILHESHQGVEKTLMKATESVFWPRMRHDIEQYISSCEKCQSYQAFHQKESMKMVEIPEYPFQECGTDIFYWKGETHIVLVDRLSRWICTDKITTTSAECVIKQLSQYFTTYGTPEVIRCDNGPPFGSNRFKEFAEQKGIRIRTSSPKYPQSNGLSERAVQTVKGFLNKAEDINCALLHYRNTPIERGLPTPAELVMGRKLRYQLPLPIEQLKPRQVWTKRELEILAEKNSKQAFYYNRTARDLRPFKEGDQVWMQEDQRQWIPAEIVKPDVTDPDRSYKVQTATGREFRRNRRFLAKRNTDRRMQTIPEYSRIQLPNQDSNNGTIQTYSSDTHASDTVHNSQLDSGKSGGTKYITRYGCEVKPTQFYKAT